MIGFLIGLVVGGLATVFWLAMFHASSGADEEQQ